MSSDAFEEAVAAALAGLRGHPDAEGLKLVLVYSFPAVEDGRRNAGVVLGGTTDMPDALRLAQAGALIVQTAMQAETPQGMCMCPKCIAERKKGAN